MTANEFNEKYKEFLEQGHYGMGFDHEEAIEYLDKEFEELIKIPHFKYTQIKAKFDWYCFYCKGVPREKVIEIQNQLKQICK